MENQRGIIALPFLIGIIVALMAVAGTTYFVIQQKSSPQTALQENINPSTEQNPTQPAPKGNIEFSEVVQINAAQDIPKEKRGYITISTDGTSAWVTDNKLAYVLTYFEPQQSALFYDGKEIYRTSEPIKGVPNITDKLAYHSFFKTFFFDGKTYDMPGTFYNAFSIKGKLLLLSSEGISYDGKPTVNTDENMQKILNLDRKIPYDIKITKDDAGLPVRSLIVNGKEIAKGAFIGEITEYKDGLAYIFFEKYKNQFEPDSERIMLDGATISKTYKSIRDLKVIGGKLAFLAERENASAGGLRHAYMLVYDGKEYGNEYDSVTGYIDNNNEPVYMVANYKKDNNGKLYISNNAQYIVKNSQTLFAAKLDEEEIRTERELLNVGGKLAAIIRSPKTNSLYLWYDGKKFFEGYDIFSILNVNGKLAVLVEKDKVQSIFLEK